MKNIIIILLVSSIVISHPVQAQQPFSMEAFEQIKSINQGKPWLTVLWSVDCPPCYKELALIQKLRSQYKLYPVIIINVDDTNEVAEQRPEVISQFGLDDLPNYYFKDGQGDKQRYSIDPYWYGELPRSYYIDAKGKFHGKSGLLKEKQLIKMLVINNAK